MRVLLATFLLIAASLNAGAQNFHKKRTQDYLRHSGVIVVETHRVLFRLDSASRDGKFALAVAHQRMARKFYEAMDYRNAVWHSAYARRLCNIVYSTYNPMLPSKFRESADEVAQATESPTDKKLQDVLLKANPGIKFNDMDYIEDNKLYRLDVDDLIQP